MIVQVRDVGGTGLHLDSGAVRGGQRESQEVAGRRHVNREVEVEDRAGIVNRQLGADRGSAVGLELQRHIGAAVALGLTGPVVAEIHGIDELPRSEGDRIGAAGGRVCLRPAGRSHLPHHITAGGQMVELVGAGGIGCGRGLAGVEHAVVVRVQVDGHVRYARLGVAAAGVEDAVVVEVVEDLAEDRPHILGRFDKEQVAVAGTGQ